MKKKSILLSLLFLLLVGFLKAQSTENWSPVMLNSDGTNVTNGVSANYMLSPSNNTVLIQLINRNPHAVKATWKDLIITQNGQKLSGSNQQETVSIAAKTKLSDDAANTTQIVVKLSDFQTNAADFKNLTVSNFDVITIQ